VRLVRQIRVTFQLMCTFSVKMTDFFLSSLFKFQTVVHYCHNDRRHANDCGTVINVLAA
jgi:hypothetical protein